MYKSEGQYSSGIRRMPEEKKVNQKGGWKNEDERELTTNTAPWSGIEREEVLCGSQLWALLREEDNRL